jgi:hypothetical protein
VIRVLAEVGLACALAAVVALAFGAPEAVVAGLAAGTVILALGCLVMVSLEGGE